MTIDGLTKPLPVKAHWYHLPKLLGQSKEMTQKLRQVQRICEHIEQIPQLCWRGAEEHLAIEAVKLRQPPPPLPLPPTSLPHVLAITSSSQPSPQSISTTESIVAAAVSAAVSAAITSPSSQSKPIRKPRARCFQFFKEGACAKGEHCNFFHHK